MDYLDQNFKNILRRNGFESLEGLREYPKEHFIKFSIMMLIIKYGGVS